MARTYKSWPLMADGLETALEMERKKYASHPVMPDLAPDHVNAQGWCYVVAGYFLVEMAFKAILKVRGTAPPGTHSLSELFDLLKEADQDTLREYYADFQATVGGRVGAFPIRDLDEFLVNLNGLRNEHGGHVGSFEWRYCLIEVSRSEEMPFVCVDYLHEVVYGCIRMIVYAGNSRFPPSGYTHSNRLRWDRKRLYDQWLEAQMLSDEWGKSGERWIVLWGPDYCGRFDLLHYAGDGYSAHFDAWPDSSEIPVSDLRRDVVRVLSSGGNSELDTGHAH